MLFLSAVGLPLQLLIIATFLSHADYRNNMCIRMMLSISVLETIQIVCHGITSLATAFDMEIDDWSACLIGGAMIAAWTAMLPQQTLLAANRFFVLGDLYGNGDKNKLRTIVFNVLLTLCWLWGVGFFISIQTPIAGMVFVRKWSLFTFTWDNLIYRKVTATVNSILWKISPIICLLIYFIVLCRLVKLKSIFSHPKPQRWATNPENAPEAPKLMKAIELKLLLQAFLGFTLVGLFVVFNYLLNENAIPVTKITVGGINLLWLLCCSFSSILNLAINKTLRQRAFFLLQFKWSRYDERRLAWDRNSNASVRRMATIT